MRDNQAHSSPLAGFNRDEAYLNALAEQMPQMQRLFVILAAGGTPNFIDIMKAINEMVAFDPDFDQKGEAVRFAGENESGKVCRFC